MTFTPTDLCKLYGFCMYTDYMIFKPFFRNNFQFINIFFLLQRRRQRQLLLRSNGNALHLHTLWLY